MGEYATRKSDGVSIKIGTCESMYYLRLEDKDKVTPDSNSGFGWFFRPPFPDEDEILPGEYDDHKRGQRFDNEFNPMELIDSPGSLQVCHDSGLMIHLPCYHGLKLPEITSEKYDTHYSKGLTARTNWNGKSWFLEFVHLKDKDGIVLPVIQCRYCGNMWSWEWNEVMRHLSGPDAKELITRLLPYAEGETEEAIGPR